MAIAELLGNVPVEKFMERYFQRTPLAMRETAQRYGELGNWNLLSRLLEQPNADILAARKGEKFDGTRPPGLTEAQALHSDGYTLLARHVERIDSALAAVAHDFYQDFHYPVDIHVYYTPKQQHGFGWHYDAEEVFILQTAGTKHYRLRKNTVNPWPRVETLPADMGFEREIMPIMNCSLCAGDWLYIPSGFWHVATTTDDDSVSLSVGLLPKAAIDVVDILHRRLTASLYWRQRLPVTGKAGGIDADELRLIYRELLSQLGDQLKAELLDESLLDELLDVLDETPR